MEESRKPADEAQPPSQSESAQMKAVSSAEIQAAAAAAAASPTTAATASKSWWPSLWSTPAGVLVKDESGKREGSG
ncbi:MAG: hypothetical protein M1818_005788 [Claussenomyces sp. TS43310]|nr:MAG: hypothetical protein M1818_005788 [Claussenomyces sp. TS43310]